MKRDEWIQKLKKLGLPGYEAQVYLALLGENSAPASRVVRKSGVPQSKVYGALNTLVERGFAEQVLGDVKLYRGIPPRQAFENHRRSVEQSLAESREDMLKLESAAPETPTEDPGSLGIRLVRHHQLKSVHDESYETAEEEILVGIKSPLVVGPDIEQDKRALRRGIKLRFLMEEAVLRDPVSGPGVLQEAEVPGLIRFVPQIPFRMFLVDRRTAMMALADEDGSPMALVVPNRGLAEGMRTLFNKMWEQGKTLEQLPDELRAATMPG